MNETASNGDVMDYTSNVIYKNNVLYQISHGEGRIVNDTYEYDIKDHLGNLRVSFKDSSGIAKITQAQDYEPFGLENWTSKFINNSKISEFKFNGIEKQKETNLYLAAFRGLDSQIGRWTQLDPIPRPSVSLYSAMDNNPILKIDPDGRDWDFNTVKNKNGTYTTTITLTVAVHNASSNSNLNMNSFASALSSQVKKSYSLSYNKKVYEPSTMTSGLDNLPSKTTYLPRTAKVNVVVNVQARVINSEGDLKSNEHLVQIQNDSKLPGVYGRANDIGGTQVYIRAGKVSNMMNGNDNNTLPHELGHTMGLHHIDKSENGTNPQFYSPSKQKANANNAMFSGGSPYMNDKTSTQINAEQIEAGKNAENNNH